MMLDAVTKTEDPNFMLKVDWLVHMVLNAGLVYLVRLVEENDFSSFHHMLSYSKW